MPSENTEHKQWPETKVIVVPILIEKTFTSDQYARADTESLGHGRYFDMDID